MNTSSIKNVPVPGGPQSNAPLGILAPETDNFLRILNRQKSMHYAVKPNLNR